MKNLLRALFLFSIISLSFVTQSQAQIVKSYTNVKDTCVNADTTAVTFGIAPSDVLAFHFKAEKVSGTVAGTATLQGSNDNTNWTTVGSAYTITNIAHNQVVYEPTHLVWKYYRVYVLTSGTCKINGIVGYTIRRTGSRL